MSTGPSYGRLVHLAKVLREAEPRYVLAPRPYPLKVQLSPEQALVLRALAAESGVSVQRAANMLLDAALSGDRVLIRRAFGVPD